jgi:hypothetical protein
MLRGSAIAGRVRGKPVAVLTVLVGCLCASNQAVPEIRQITSGIFWNRVARELVQADALSPPRASRVYAYLSLAQQRALITFRQSGRAARDQAARECLIRRVVSAASLTVISGFFPKNRATLADSFRVHEAHWRCIRPGDPANDFWADEIGRIAGSDVLHQAKNDGADTARSFTPLVVHNGWRGAPEKDPVEPMWSEVRPLGLESVPDFSDLVPPPPVGGPAFKEALDAVRTSASQAGREELSSVFEWADGAGTSTPPGHWNSIAEEMITRHNLPEERAVEIIALLNVALFDASILCWKTKYDVRYPRPSQVDPSIPRHLPVPNFPSFTSGHATFSSAAATILTFFFPSESGPLNHMAQKAALSRIYAGIHYPFDSEIGSRHGHAVARLILQRYMVRGEHLYDNSIAAGNRPQ